MDHSSEAAQVLRRSLDAFLSKDMKAWSELCAQNVVVEFPFAPEGSSSKIEGRQAIYEYLRNYPDMIDIKEITANPKFSYDANGNMTCMSTGTSCTELLAGISRRSQLQYGGHDCGTVYHHQPDL